MISTTLLDIINTEPSLGEKILLDNNIHVITRCNNTCSIFKNITYNENRKNKIEDFVVKISNKIEDSMKKFACAYLGSISKRYLSSVDKEYISYYMNSSKMNIEIFELEYHTALEAYGNQINNTIYYDYVLEKVIKKIKEYLILSNKYIRQGFLDDFSKTMLIYYLSFIICNMNYKISIKDFEEKESITSMLNNIFIQDIFAM